MIFKTLVLLINIYMHLNLKKEQFHHYVAPHEDLTRK